MMTRTKAAVVSLIVISAVSIVVFLPVFTVRPCPNGGNWIGCTFLWKESISLYYLGYGAKSVEGHGQSYYDLCTPNGCSNL